MYLCASDATLSTFALLQDEHLVSSLAGGGVLFSSFFTKITILRENWEVLIIIYYSSLLFLFVLFFPRLLIAFLWDEYLLPTRLCTASKFLPAIEV
ncbi:hypothetical protein B9Z19DRAFT_669567 [Tuber borchii]|uniref:Uncharacterized protein n=1 Tax=Tuber borchii TaxID=42251 RepID=A0A2T6ZZK7_TUBBO|nr:hypothetical protein B9Z19DRAFT_669567 [Tuber borchii]